jgi:hypothetical protein
MAMNLLGGSKYKMPEKASSEELNRIVERGQKTAAAGANWNVSPSPFLFVPTPPIIF